MAKSINNEVEIKGENMLIGTVDREAFEFPDYKSWFDETYTSYELRKEDLPKIKENLNGAKIKCFLGTWCSDSQREVPAFYKILDAIDFDYSNIEIIAIDRSKKLPKEKINGNDIEYVPTFIFYRNNSELGRIIEIPSVGLEEDMLSILNN